MSILDDGRPRVNAAGPPPVQPDRHDPPRPGTARNTCPHCQGVLPGNRPWPVSLERAHAYELRFGKHAGRTLGELAEDDPGYLKWMLGVKAADTDNRSHRLALLIAILLLNGWEEGRYEP